MEGLQQRPSGQVDIPAATVETTKMLLLSYCPLHIMPHYPGPNLLHNSMHSSERSLNVKKTNDSASVWKGLSWSLTTNLMPVTPLKSCAWTLSSSDYFKSCVEFAPFDVTVWPDINYILSQLCCQCPWPRHCLRTGVGLVVIEATYCSSGTG